MGTRVSSSVQGEWVARSIPREVWGAWVRLFLGDAKDQQTSRVFLSPIHVSCFDCDYVRLFGALAHSRKVRGVPSVFCTDNDFRCVSYGVWCRARVVHVFFPKSSSAVDGLPYSRSRHHCWARGRSPVGKYCLVPGTCSYKAGCVGELRGAH